MARVNRSLVALACATACGSALADPFSLIATALVQFGGFSAIANIGILAGAALLGAADARRKQRSAAAAQKAQYNASLQDRNVSVLNNEAPWRVVYGSPAPIGGAVVAILTSGPKDEFKHFVLVFAAHECLAIDEIYIEGEALGALDGNGWVTGGTFMEQSKDRAITEGITFDGSGNGTASFSVGSLLSITSMQGEYSSIVSGSANGTTINCPSLAGGNATVSYTYSVNTPRVNVQKHLSPGGVDTADAFLQGNVPSKWTAAHKLSGYTYIVLTLDLNFGRFQGGPPNVTAKLRGKNVYDYRTATTGYSNNVALCTADFLTNQYGMGATIAQIDSAAAIAAANACDAQGFTCDGVISTDQARDANLTMLEDAMAGGTHFSGGVWRILAGNWNSPVLTLSDTPALAGAIEVVQASQPKEGRFNGVRGQYVPASGLGVATDFTPYSVATYLSADGSPQVKDASYPMTATNAQCQKLAAIAVEQSRLGLTINYPAHLLAWKLQPGDRVTVNNTELGFVSKTFRVVDWTYISNAPIGLVLTEDLASVWTGTFSTPDAQLATSNLADPYARPAAPANLLANSGTGILQRASDGTITTRVLVTWQASTVRSVLQGGYTQLQWRLATATDDRWQSQDLAADASQLYLTGPQDGTAILIRVRFMTGLLVQGTWQTISHQVVGKTAPPAAPSYVAATQTLVFWGAVTDVDLAGYRVRAFPGSTGAVFSRATPLHNDLLTTAPWPITTRLYGIQTIMVVAEDTTGNQSAAVSTVLDFGQPDASNAVQSLDYRALGWPVLADIIGLAVGRYSAYAACNVARTVRNSIATYFDGSNVLQTATANVARFEGGQLLVEAAATNNLLYSEQLDNAAWTRSGGLTVTANSGVAPDGTTTMDTLTDPDPAQFAALNQDFYFSAGQNCCASMFVLKDAVGAATRFPIFRLITISALAGGHVDIAFDTSTGTWAANQALGASLTYLGGGVIDEGTHWRVWVALRCTDVLLTGYSVFVYPAVGSGALVSYGPPVTGSIKAWGMMTETGSTPSSYIATTGAMATRAADAIDISTVQRNWTVSGGNLVATADAASDRYALADVYGEADNYATSYLPMSYVATAFVPFYQGGTVTVNPTIAGASSTLEYQIDGSTLIDNYASADCYAAADLYGASSSFAAWPNALLTNRMQGIVFRVTVAGGATQGVVSAFAPALVMPDVRQTFGNVVVPSAGLRLAPSAGTPVRNWIVLKTVQGTPVVDSGGAIAARVIDFSPTLGPLTQLVDNTGTAVAGRATFDIGGLADG